VNKYNIVHLLGDDALDLNRDLLGHDLLDLDDLLNGIRPVK
jgi:hypothetical protein